MSECAGLDRITEHLGDEPTDSTLEELREHIATCPECRRRLAGISELPSLLSAVEGEHSPGNHLTDLDLAAFSAHGVRAAGSSAIIVHLAECSECRRALAAVCMALDRHDRDGARRDEEGARHSGLAIWWSRVRADLRQAFSSPRGASLLLAALVCYLSECLLLAVTMSQLVMAYVLSPGMDAVPTWGPLGSVEPAALRLWIVVLSAIVLALGLRWVSRWLYADASRRTEGVAGG